MIPRTATRQVTRLQSSSFASSSRLPVRNISTSVQRPSRIARGKLPAASASVLSARQFSWTPWKTSSTTQPAPSDPASAQSASSPLPAEVEVAPSTSLSTPLPPSSSAASQATTEQATDIDPTSTTSPADTASATPVDSSSSNDLATASTDATSAIHPVVPTNPDATITDLISANPEIPLEQLLRTPEAIEAVLTRHDLPALGLGHGWFSPIGWICDGLVSLHHLTGLPWWATIAATTLAIRLCIVRVIIEAQKHNIRFAAIQPQMQGLQEGSAKALKEGNRTEAGLYAQALQNLWKEHGVHPLRMIKAPLIQAPVFITVFYALRRLADVPIPGFLDGGLGWVTDLTASDPYFVLPVLSVLFTNIVLRVGADGTGQNAATSNAGFGRHMKNIVAGVSVLSLVFVSRFPAAVLFYWTTSGFFTLLQAAILKTSFAKRLFNIPTPPKVDAPPGAPKGEPSFKETALWVRDSFKQQYQQKRDEQIAKVAASEKRAMAQGKRIGTEKMSKEIVREKKRN